MKADHSGEGWVYLPPIFEYRGLLGLISMPRYMVEVQFKNVSDYNFFYWILNLCLFSSITPYSSELFESIKKSLKKLLLQNVQRLFWFRK